MADPLIGRLVANRFEVKRVLGHGGMGAVYEAVQRPVGRRVALKVLKGALRDSERLQARFLREAQAIAQLNHPNIVTLYDFGVDDEGVTYIAMEYVEGYSLFDFLDRDIDLAFIVHVMGHVIDALIEAHSAGIIHRDLKPENIMLTNMGGDDRFAKVLDFGLARVAEDVSDVSLTAAGEVFGTPLYMSPEQANGEDVTPATDVYALGCILFQLITGEPPFYSERPMTLLMLHTNEPAPQPVPLPGLSASPALLDIVSRCLEKDPASRYADAIELMEALAQTPESAHIVHARTSGRVDSLIPSIAPIVQGDGERRSHTIDLPQGTNPPPFLAEATPTPTPDTGVETANIKQSNRPPMVVLIGVGAAVLLLIVGGYMALRGGSSSGAGDAAAEEVEPMSEDEIRAFTRAQIMASVEAGLDAVIMSQLTHLFNEGVQDPNRRPDKGVKLRKASSSPFHHVIKRRHIRKVPNVSYVDPVDLLFGG